MQNSSDPLFLCDLEDEIKSIHQISSEVHSFKLKSILYVSVFEKILASSNPNIIEAYTSGLINDFTHSVLCTYPEGLKPDFLNRLISILSRLSELEYLKNICSDIEKAFQAVISWQQKQSLILSGKIDLSSDQNFYIPLLENLNCETESVIGLLETVTVKIGKCKSENKFLIVPSEEELEKLIDEQIKLSWQNAQRVIKNYVRKTEKYHEVVIHFNKRAGFCRGNSLGAALTILFIEELLKFYNPKYIIQAAEGLAVTGGMDEQGNILSVGDEIIKQKTELIFFSLANQFVIPKVNEQAAIDKLIELKKQFPERELKIIAVEDLQDLLSRRNIVDIKKQKVIVRTGKFVKKNLISAVATVLIAILFGYLFVMDFDDNPALLESDGATLFVKNKNGKLLWTKSVNIEKDELANNLSHSKAVRIIDINNDGNYEILIANEQGVEGNEFNTSCYLKCYDKYQKLIWKYNFTETVITKRGQLKPFYNIFMLDTLTVQNKNSMFVFANSSSSFSSAIFSIDMKTGKKNAGTIWCSGHTTDGMIKDINGDKRKDVICLGLDNGYEDVVVFGNEIDSINKVRPTTDDYLINNYPVGNFITYIRIPKNDFENYLENRFTSIAIGSFKYLMNEKKYYFILNSEQPNRFNGIWYKVDENLKDFEIAIDNQFRVVRDSLVVQGKLNLPYSDTKEYENILKDRILYWKDGKWVNRKDLDK